uniref:Ig-like domain-containing protein n=1 Tax=Sparus aurata TaxID=8175 RepID=A0A671TL56_SPAAU
MSWKTVEIQMESVSSVEMSGFDIKLSASPELLMEMSDVRVKSGEMAEFNCSFDGQPFTGVVWDHNGQKLADTERVRSSHNEGLLSLVIQGVGVADQGVYRCTATNQHGQNSSSARLTVEGFTKTIESLQLSEGGQAVFRYIVTGDPLPEVHWLKGSFNIQPSGFCIIVNNPDGSGFINIKSVKHEHAGVYTCKASNQYGEASCTAELLVFRENVQEELTVYVGKRAMIQCVISGSAPLNVVWFKDNMALPSMPKKYETSCEKNKHTLGITTLEVADKGLYVCKVSNNVGTAECSMDLRVIDKPNFVKPLATTVWKQGGTARLQCTVKGSPELHTSWFFNNSELSAGDRYGISLKDGVTTLEIKDVALSDSGNYTCEVLNESGCESCSTKVTVKGVQT